MDAVTRVKICGITRPADAELAVELGAWAIGLIFHADSPRACEPAVAAEVAASLRRRVELVGVFANAHLDEVAELADGCSLSMLQLHGDEGPAYCAEIARRTGCRVIKAARVRDASSIQALRAYNVDYHLLDAFHPSLLGGTGAAFEWELAGTHPGRPPLILSGGIDADNAARAIATVRPFAIDSASGTEAAPGRKDPAKLRALFATARAAERAIA